MDNNLSELSKPVATVDVQRGRMDGNMFGIAWSSAGHALPDGPHFLYSQEYVSALDKVAQFWIGESAGWKKRAEAAEAFRDQMLKYVRTLGSSAISPSVVETILNAAERSKAGK
ncbi:hypothetical protein I5R28_18660 [Serratia marcescens]|nr:hypothetical protein [Serratia marcescens]